MIFMYSETFPYMWCISIFSFINGGYTNNYALGSRLNRFQTAMRPTVPSSEIEKVSRELEKFASEFGEVIIPENIPRYLQFSLLTDT